jgi:hypothetical protein
MRCSWKNFTSTIERFVNRKHVSVADKQIETEVRKAIARSRKLHPDWKISKATESACVKYALKCHAKNQKLYNYLMGGMHAS